MNLRLTAALGVALASLACSDESHPPYADDSPVSVRPVMMPDKDAGDSTPAMVVATLPEGPDSFDGTNFDKDHVYFYGYLPVGEGVPTCYPNTGQAALGQFAHPDKAFGTLGCDQTQLYYIGHDGALLHPLGHKRLLLEEAAWEENEDGELAATEALPSGSEATSPDVYPTDIACYHTSSTLVLETPDPERYVISCIVPPPGTFVPDVVGLAWNDGTDMQVRNGPDVYAVDMEGNALIVDTQTSTMLYMVSADGEHTDIGGDLLPGGRPLHGRAISGGGFWLLYRAGGLTRVRVEADGSVTESVRLAALPDLKGVKYTGTDGESYDAVGIGLDYRFCVLSGQGDAYCPGIYGSPLDMDRAHVLVYLGEIGEALVLLPEWLRTPRAPLDSQPQLLPPLRALTGRW